MKSVILYKSFSGSTKQYAQWLAEETRADIFKFGEISNDKLKEYEQVVVMSATYCGYMPLVGFLKKNWLTIKDKKVLAVAIGSAPADDKISQRSFERIPVDIRQQISYIKIAGATPFANVEKKALEIKKENLKSVLEQLL